MQTLTKRLNHIKHQVVSRLVYAINPQLIYGKKAFYEDTREAKIASVKAAADLIMDVFGPKNVVDIGCGEGLFLSALHQNGVSVVGCDISEAALFMSPKDFVIFQADATKPIQFNRTFELCICIEIAEHIPTRHSRTLVRNVTRASDTVFFTAAPPWQGGVGHINEQPAEFWITLFEKEGFQLDRETTQQLQAQLKAKGVLFWLYQNLMIFSRKK